MDVRDDELLFTVLRFECIGCLVLQPETLRIKRDVTD